METGLLQVDQTQQFRSFKMCIYLQGMQSGHSCCMHTAVCIWMWTWSASMRPTTWWTASTWCCMPGGQRQWCSLNNAVCIGGQRTFAGSLEHSGSCNSCLLRHLLCGEVTPAQQTHELADEQDQDKAARMLWTTGALKAGRQRQQVSLQCRCHSLSAEICLVIWASACSTYARTGGHRIQFLQFPWNVMPSLITLSLHRTCAMHG